MIEPINPMFEFICQIGRFIAHSVRFCFAKVSPRGFIIGLLNSFIQIDTYSKAEKYGNDRHFMRESKGSSSMHILA